MHQRINLNHLLFQIFKTLIHFSVEQKKVTRSIEKSGNPYTPAITAILQETRCTYWKLYIC